MSVDAGGDIEAAITIPNSLAWRVPAGIGGKIVVHSALIFWLIETLRPRLIVTLAAPNSDGLRAHQLSAYAAMRAGTDCMTVLGLSPQDLRNPPATPETVALQRVVRGHPGPLSDQLEPGSIDLLILDGRHDSQAIAQLIDRWPAMLSPRGVVLWHDAGEVADAVWPALGVQPWQVMRSGLGAGLALAVTGPQAPAAITSLRDAANGRGNLGLLNLLGRLGEAQVAADGLARMVRNQPALKKLEQDLATANRRAKRAEARVDAIEHSNSWRITRPLRALTARLSPVGRKPAQTARPAVPAAKAAPKPIADAASRSVMVQQASILGWPDHSAHPGMRVIGVMDEFTAKSFGPQINLIQPRPDNWFALCEKYRPELIFIESAWKGNFGSWQYRVGTYSNSPGPELAELCAYGKEHQIPVIFLNKEDPIHHDKFMAAASLVDHIFTSDENMVASYRSRTGNSNVDVLPFAAQPAIHRPAALAGRKQAVCFAGSWYANRHAARAEEMEWLLRAALPFNLEIYDRNFGSGIFPFPQEFQASVRGSLPYAELCDEYRRYRVFLNVNSVTTSPTMFSRRVFELLASGTPIVSTYSEGLEQFFDGGAIWLVKGEAEARDALQTLMTDDAEWRRRSLLGIREVFAKHTYAHRLDHILARIGKGASQTADPQLLLVANAASAQELSRLKTFADGQDYRNFKLVVATETPSGYDDGKVEQTLPRDLPARFNDQAAAYRYFGVISAADHYDRGYLVDMVNATRYAANAAGWTKSANGDAFALGARALPYHSIWTEAADALAILDGSAGPSRERADVYAIDAIAEPIRQAAALPAGM